MEINPMELLKLKDRLNLFRKDHPRVGSFMSAVREDMRPGAVLELKVTSPEGKELVTNIKMNENDIETLRLLANLRGKK